MQRHKNSKKDPVMFRDWQGKTVSDIELDLPSVINVYSMTPFASGKFSFGVIGNNHIMGWHGVENMENGIQATFIADYLFNSVEGLMAAVDNMQSHPFDLHFDFDISTPPMESNNMLSHGTHSENRNSGDLTSPPVHMMPAAVSSNQSANVATTARKKSTKTSAAAKQSITGNGESNISSSRKRKSASAAAMSRPAVGQFNAHTAPPPHHAGRKKSQQTKISFPAGAKLSAVTNQSAEQDEEWPGWACPKCSLDNKPLFLVCELCGAERPHHT